MQNTDGWSEIITEQQSVITDTNEKGTTRNEATGILKTLKRLESAIMALIKDKFLERFNATY